MERQYRSRLGQRSTVKMRGPTYHARHVKTRIMAIMAPKHIRGPSGVADAPGGGTRVGSKVLLSPTAGDCTSSCCSCRCIGNPFNMIVNILLLEFFVSCSVGCRLSMVSYGIICLDLTVVRVVRFSVKLETTNRRSRRTCSKTHGTADVFIIFTWYYKVRKKLQIAQKSANPWSCVFSSMSVRLFSFFRLFLVKVLSKNLISPQFHCT